MNSDLITWYKISEELARQWAKSISFRSRTKIEEDDIRFFLVDHWIKKGGRGPEFAPENRGMLYHYTSQHLCHSRDALSVALSIADLQQAGREDDEIEEDRFEWLSYHGHGEVVDGWEQDEAPEELEEYLDELRALRDTELSSTLSDIFGVSDRRARSFAAEIRREKTVALVLKAARQRGLSPAEVRKLAAEVAADCRRAGAGIPSDEIEAFEQMWTTATQEKTHLPQERAGRPAAQQPLQLELA